MPNGFCKAKIYNSEGEHTEVELTYEYDDKTKEVFVSRPDVADASDLYTDVVDALYADRLPQIDTLHWL